MRCPDCGATNPEHATFCGQCHARFGVVEPAAPPEPGAWSPGPATGPAPDDDARPAVTRGRFVAEDGAVGWTCAVCEEVNGLDVFTCTICGTRMDTERGATRADLDWDAAKRIEAMIPGAGHMRVGLAGPGLARLLVAGAWLIGALLLATGGVRGLVTALPLMIGIGTMMVLGPGDLDAASKGRTGRLEGRAFGGLIAAVILAVIIIGAVQAILA